MQKMDMECACVFVLNQWVYFLIFDSLECTELPLHSMNLAGWILAKNNQRMTFVLVFLCDDETNQSNSLSSKF